MGSFDGPLMEVSIVCLAHGQLVYQTIRFDSGHQIVPDVLRSLAENGAR